MIRFVDRGLKHMVDVITSDAARNQLRKNQLVQHPQISAINVAMEGIVQCFNKAQSVRVTTEFAASRKSIMEASLKHGSKTGPSISETQEREGTWTL